MEVMVLCAGEAEMIEIPMEDRVYQPYTWQVRNMLENWPGKTSGGVEGRVSTANERPGEGVVGLYPVFPENSVCWIYVLSSLRG